MWETQQNGAGLDYFKTLALQEILKSQNQHQADSYAFSEVKHLCQQGGCARNKRQYLTAPQNRRSYRWMLVCVSTVYLRLTYGIWPLKY